MANSSATRSRGDLAHRVVLATVTLILTKGLRRLRTADIAVAAETTETTMFRHFDNLDDILRTTYDYCWELINEHVGQATFDNPCPGGPQEQLLADMSALWALSQDESARNAATLAFLFMRRRAEMFASPTETSDQQVRFERRLEQLCEQVAKEGNSERDPRLLVQLLMNYAATVWLTWFCMPKDCDDVTGDHDLSEDEAQLGVLVLLDRFLSGVGPTGRRPVR